MTNTAVEAVAYTTADGCARYARPEPRRPVGTDTTPAFSPPSRGCCGPTAAGSESDAPASVPATEAIHMISVER